MQMLNAAPAPGGSLQSFQDAFACALLAPHASAATASEVTSLLTSLTTQPGFDVYRNTVMKGCIDALQANYPAVARLVGDEWFRAAAAHYVREHLPQQPSLLSYGEGFDAFLATFAPASQLPYLSGVARLDRFWTEAHIARDDVPVDASYLKRLDAGSFTPLQLHASTRWAWFDAQPIFTIWDRNRDRDPVDESAIDWVSEGALIVRPRDAVTWVRVDAATCALLDACAARCSVAQAAAAASAMDSTAQPRVLLARLLELGAFTRPLSHPIEDRHP